MYFCFARVHCGNLGVQIAPILLRHPHIQHHRVDQLQVHFAPRDQLGRAKAYTFLVYFGIGPRQRRRYCATHIGVVDMPHGKGDNLTLPKDRLPDVQIGGMSADKPGIRVVCDADITFLVAINGFQRPLVIKTNEPCRAQIAGAGKGHPSG